MASDLLDRIHVDITVSAIVYFFPVLQKHLFLLKQTATVVKNHSGHVMEQFGCCSNDNQKECEKKNHISDTLNSEKLVRNQNNTAAVRD